MAKKLEGTLNAKEVRNLRNRGFSKGPGIGSLGDCVLSVCRRREMFFFLIVEHILSETE